MSVSSTEYVPALVLAGLAQDEAPGIFAMPLRVQPEVQCDGPRLAAAPGAAIADDIGGALDESRLRARLRFDDLDVHRRSVLLWRRSVLMLDRFAAAVDGGTAAILCLPILKAHLGGGVLVGGWFSQGVVNLHLLPVDHEPEELAFIAVA